MLRAFTKAQRAASVRQFSTETSCFLGSPAPYTEDLFFTTPGPLIPVYRVTDNQGNIINKDYKIKHTDADLVNMYQYMIKLNNMDKIFYDAQRQGRISFYMTAFGEEATHIGCASALAQDDIVLAQYREAGVLMWRGFSLEQFAHQCFGTHKDLGKGRQMPVHYGSKALHFQTVSSPLTTQLPQAVGAAYALKNEGTKRIAVAFCGEGAASEGDFHAALNFSATLEAPVMFFFRNNGYAISTPVKDQYRGDGIAARAAGYGIHCVRVDGNDLLAVHDATKYARDYIIQNNKPCLVEAMSYRAGHHSTSDDATRYRSIEEINNWQTTNNPINRFRHILEQRGLWDETKEAAAHEEARNAVLAALNDGEVAKKPALSQLFDDVYDTMPKNLQEQKAELEAHLKRFEGEYYLGDFIAEEEYENPALKQ